MRTDGHKAVTSFVNKHTRKRKAQMGRKIAGSPREGDLGYGTRVKMVENSILSVRIVRFGRSFVCVCDTLM